MGQIFPNALLFVVFFWDTLDRGYWPSWSHNCLHLSVIGVPWDLQRISLGSWRNWSVISANIREPLLSPARNISRTCKIIFIKFFKYFCSLLKRCCCGKSNVCVALYVSAVVVKNFLVFLVYRYKVSWSLTVLQEF